MASALSCMGLELSVWDGIRQVAEAAIKEFHYTAADLKWVT